MNKLILLLCLSMNITAKSQINSQQLAAPIVAEGKLLYYMEMALRQGTATLAKHGLIHEDTSLGFLSYVEKNKARCIFFSGSDEPEVAFTITFREGFEDQDAVVTKKKRSFSDLEKDIYNLRKQARALIGDTIFKSYNNTYFEYYPLISNNEKKVYITTTSREDGVAVFGNDYVLGFDQDNNLIYKKKLHPDIMFLYYGTRNKEETTQPVGNIHKHLPGYSEFITPTDIYTLMLHEQDAGWQSYVVVSERYTSIWNCISNSLVILPTSQPRD